MPRLPGRFITAKNKIKKPLYLVIPAFATEPTEYPGHLEGSCLPNRTNSHSSLDKGIARPIAKPAKSHKSLDKGIARPIAKPCDDVMRGMRLGSALVPCGSLRNRPGKCSPLYQYAQLLGLPIWFFYYEVLYWL